VKWRGKRRRKRKEGTGRKLDEIAQNDTHYEQQELRGGKWICVPRRYFHSRQVPHWVIQQCTWSAYGALIDLRQLQCNVVFA